MDIVIKNAGELAQILAQMNEISLRLMQHALDKEVALRADDINMLKDIVEQEEDVLGEFALLEKKRIARTVELADALGLDREQVSLSQIAEKLTQEDVRGELLQAGAALGKTVTELRDKNAVLTEIINLKNDYAGVMLEALTVGKETNRNYNASGMIENPGEDSPGVVEFFA